MTGTSKPAAMGDGDRGAPGPGQLLQEVNALRGRTSAAARGYWIPLLLFGAVICGSLPFYQRLKQAQPISTGPPASGPCRAITPNRPCHVTAGAGHVTVGVGHVTVVTALGYYWQIAIPAVVLLTVLWYRWRGNRVGLRTPARGFLITGMILGELVLLLSLLLATQSGQPNSLTRILHHEGALVIIAAVLWVLAWAERSKALAIIVAVYLAVALPVSHYTGGGLAGGNTGAADLNLTALRVLGLLPALTLLAAGSGVLLSQRLQLRHDLQRR